MYLALQAMGEKDPSWKKIVQRTVDTTLTASAMNTNVYKRNGNICTMVVYESIQPIRARYDIMMAMKTTQWITTNVVQIKEICVTRLTKENDERDLQERNNEGSQTFWGVNNFNERWNVNENDMSNNDVMVNRDSLKEWRKRTKFSNAGNHFMAEK